MTPFRLTQGQRRDPLWMAIKAHLEKELATQRSKNDSPNLDPTTTALIRGRIAQLKDLLLLDKEDVPVSD